jgi:hypothetical protein
VKWLKSKLDKFLSPLNEIHFSELWWNYDRYWTWTTRKPTKLRLLLDVMQECCYMAFHDEDSEYRSVEHLRSVANMEHSLLLPVSQVCS